ncbi:MAG: non-canonical purine NTP pyrophosphatase [Patescibacteria group bacterium]
MKRLLIATTNSGKIEEIKIGLKSLEKQGIKVLTLNDVRVGDNEPEETGKTFQENAFIKAKFYADLTHLPVLSDDGGLIIPYLNNEPGVKSRRWLGYEATDEELIKFALSNLRGCTGSKRTAYLETCLYFYDPQTNKVVYETEKISGRISTFPSFKIVPGYPYRAIFIVDKFNKYYDELTEDEHHEVNHRLIALKRLTKKIEDLI